MRQWVGHLHELWFDTTHELRQHKQWFNKTTNVRSSTNGREKITKHKEKNDECTKFHYFRKGIKEITMLWKLSYFNFYFSFTFKDGYLSCSICLEKYKQLLFFIKIYGLTIVSRLKSYIYFQNSFLYFFRESDSKIIVKIDYEKQILLIDCKNKILIFIFLNNSFINILWIKQCT